MMVPDCSVRWCRVIIPPKDFGDEKTNVLGNTNHSGCTHYKVLCTYIHLSYTRSKFFLSFVLVARWRWSSSLLVSISASGWEEHVVEFSICKSGEHAGWRWRAPDGRRKRGRPLTSALLADFCLKHCNALRNWRDTPRFHLRIPHQACHILIKIQTCN